MVDIATSAPTWAGTPRLNTNQHIQDAIDANAAGTTYLLKAGTHRGQRVSLKANDIFEFEDGAIMAGSEDISGSWTAVGDGTWWKNVSRSLLDPQSDIRWIRSGYLPYQNDWVIVDGKPHSYRSSNDLTSNAMCAYSDGTRIYVNTDPTAVTVEIARERRAIVGSTTGVTVRTEDGSYQGIVENYASSMQAPRAAVQGGRLLDSYIQQSATNWTYENIVVRNCAGAGVGIGGNCSMTGMKIYNNGQIGFGMWDTDNWTLQYSELGPSNCLSGISAGWEGGNSKMLHSNGGTIRGCYIHLEDGMPNNDGLSILWWDIRNINDVTEACLLEDNTSAGGSSHGGIFYEVSDPTTIRNNRIIGSSRNSANAGWAKAIQVADGLGVFANHIKIYDNHIYNCGGGIGGNMRGRGGLHYLDIHDNITHLDTSLSYVEEVGLNKWEPGTINNNDYYDNAYYITPGDSRWIDQSDDNNIGKVAFSTWQSSGGHDTNGYAVAPTGNPINDPNPSNGGCVW